MNCHEASLSASGPLEENTVLFGYCAFNALINNLFGPKSPPVIALMSQLRRI